MCTAGENIEKMFMKLKDKVLSELLLLSLHLAPMNPTLQGSGELKVIRVTWLYLAGVSCHKTMLFK